MNKLTKTLFDVVIVGSGPAGVHAAYPLVENGLNVAIIDGGLDSKKKDKKLIDFSEACLPVSSRAFYLLKKSSYVFNTTYQLLKIKSNVEIIQSLAKGGLSESWHGICDFYSAEELKKIGLPVDEMQKEYSEIALRIKLKKRINLDFHSNLLFSAYKRKGDFKSTAYQAPVVFPYRTSLIIDKLRLFKNFTYIPNQLVFVVKKRNGHIEVLSKSINELTDRVNSLSAKYLILAAGPINTTRILLRSFNLYNYRTTFLTKANYITACFHARTIARKSNSKKSRAGQLVISSNYTVDGLGSFFMHMYNFNPKVIHEVLKYIPLPKVISYPFLSMIASSLVIADIRFPALPSKKKFCFLKKESDKNDILEISFEESREELENHRNEFRKIKKQLWLLGLFPLKTVNDYITTHYAGGVPFQKIPGKLSVNEFGMLHNAKRIYVADSSTWRALPAKPLTLTIMANASRVGKNVLKNFDQE